MLEGFGLNIDKLVWVGYGVLITALLYYLCRWFLVSVMENTKIDTDKIKKYLIFIWGIIIILLLISGMFKHDNKSPDMGADYTKQSIKNYTVPSKEDVSAKNEKYLKDEEQQRKAKIKNEQAKNSGGWKSFLETN